MFPTADYFERFKKPRCPINGGLEGFATTSLGGRGMATSSTRTAYKSIRYCDTGIWVPKLPGSGHKVESVKPSKSKVEIEELDSDLLSGVRVCSLDSSPIVVKSDKPLGWPSVFYITVTDNNWVREDDEIKEGKFVLPIECYIKDDEKVKPEEIWTPFICQDVDSCVLLNGRFPKYQKGKKTHKVSQRFMITLQTAQGDKKLVPFVQFRCIAKWAKIQNAVFKEGDLITYVIKHPKYPLHWPNPPVVTVIPTTEQTFVPMLSKQKMVVLVNSKEYNIDYKPHTNSTILADSVVDADFGIQCNFFACTKPTHSSEIIFLNHKKKKKENKKIVIPFVDKEVRCPIILNPLNDAVIYSQNIDGFIIRFWKESAHPITILNGTPIKGVHTSENAQFIERRFEIEKRRPFFYLVKKDHSWVIQ